MATFSKFVPRRQMLKINEKSTNNTKSDNNKTKKGTGHAVMYAYMPLYQKCAFSTENIWNHLLELPKGGWLSCRSPSTHSVDRSRPVNVRSTLWTVLCNFTTKPYTSSIGNNCQSLTLVTITILGV